MRNTFRVMSDWGDEIERRHFDGDFKGALSNARTKAGERVRGIGEGLGSATAKLVQDAMQEAASVDRDGLGQSGSLFRSPARASTSQVTTSGAGGYRECAGPWEEVQDLQSRLATERLMRRGRAAALSTLGEEVRELREKLVEERRKVDAAEAARAAAISRCERIDAALEEQQELKHCVETRRSAQEAEHRRLTLASAAAQLAAREASREGAWARDGPETEALKDAKLELAELLSQLDEVKLQARRETVGVQSELEAEQVDHARMLQELEQQAASRSLRESGSTLKRLLFTS